MPDIVFIHCQTYSRKPNQAGQCVSQVIAEGLRSGGYHPHVAQPKSPVPVLGNPSEFQQLHDAHVAVRRTPAMKDGRVRERAVRTDRHTLFTLVASYPVPHDQHAAIVQAVLDRDTDAAHRLMLDHIGHTFLIVRNILTTSGTRSEALGPARSDVA